RDECGPASEPPCPDDGKFCNGEEFCDTESDACASEGSPCNLTVEVCVDDEDTCKAVEDLEVGGDGLGDGDKDGGCCSC
ncbi:hypothetical protein KDL45_15245, partial [bacterium]|nr:hypothetical protein [bacterium]